MLTVLRVGNLALVDELELQLGPGLTMVTGETGAGKSLIAGALSLLAGGKASKELIRRGTDLAFVEGVFDLGDCVDDLQAMATLGVRVGADGILVLRRELRSEGRGRTLINGLVSSLSLLEQIGQRLLSIQSQDQQRQLARPGFSGEFLDGVLGLDDEVAAMEAALTGHRSLADDLALRNQEEELARQQMEMWEYQHRELTEAGLDPDEQAVLAEKLAMGRNARNLLDGATVCRQSLTEGETNAQGLLGSAESVLAPLAADSSGLAAILDMIRVASANTAEAAADLERFLDQMELDPARLDEMETRESLYRELVRKYNRDVDGLIELRDELSRRITRQGRAATDLAELGKAVERARERVQEQARLLHGLRLEGAPKVARQAVGIIRGLALPELDLGFHVAPIPDTQGWIDVDGVKCMAGPRGADRIDLWARTNKGEAPGDVARIASGGEKSRIFLGLSVMDDPTGGNPLRLYDEIDAGLGMDNAVPVAEQLVRLSEKGQVVCITHLPTVACRGGAHWRVFKNQVDERTVLRAEALDEQGRVLETARLLGGDAVEQDVSESQLNYARQLLAGSGRSASGIG
jgi:DNA repair protein RecN (Recombination protein N)